jgi:BlaI family penicillinase repressor
MQAFPCHPMSGGCLREKWRIISLLGVDLANCFAKIALFGEEIRHKSFTERDTTMPRLPSSQPTEVELQILRILWEHGPSTARQIHNQLVEARDTNYSTAVKMLSVMLDKNLVKRDETVRPQVFRTAATQDRTQQRMLKDLIQKAYDGSVGSLVLQALSSQRSSPGELAEIRRLLNELEGGPK